MAVWPPSEWPQSTHVVEVWAPGSLSAARTRLIVSSAADAPTMYGMMPGVPSPWLSLATKAQPFARNAFMMLTGMSDVPIASDGAQGAAMPFVPWSHATTGQPPAGAAPVGTIT